MKRHFIFPIIVFFSAACNSYLDVVPDDIATIETAFTMRSNAERFLFTCYSYLPPHGELNSDPAMLAGDELWLADRVSTPMKQVALGFQQFTEPYGDYYGPNSLYNGIRDCNIFLENIGKVPGMIETERQRWISEVLFLKAYYHFFLLRMYGPVTIVDKNLPISAGTQEVKLYRSPFDTCVDYIVALIDSASTNLPPRILNETNELGRITQVIALSVKAQVLVTAASPLFNGNPDYGNFANANGERLFNAAYDSRKWERAAEACREAIELAEANGYKLYEYVPQFTQFNLSKTMLTQLSIRNSITALENPELIWGGFSLRDYNTTRGLQAASIPRGIVPAYGGTNNQTRGYLGVPLKIVQTFYTENGVPFEEDRTRNPQDRFTLREGDAANRLFIKNGYTTADLNFNREPRYYASLGFDGGIWYGQGAFDDGSDQLYFISSKHKQPAAEMVYDSYSVTGYWPKKLVHYESIVEQINFAIEDYPYPIFRLADLYLLYAEALNEAYGPSDESIAYIDKVRERAGLTGVVDAWRDFSTSRDKPTTQLGLRDIIRRERLNELAFEGKRFWDLRRWKLAGDVLNEPITGWDLAQSEASFYYREQLIYNQIFTMRDYLWPISEVQLLQNENLVQNPGWPGIN